MNEYGKHNAPDLDVCQPADDGVPSKFTKVEEAVSAITVTHATKCNKERLNLNGHLKYPISLSLTTVNGKTLHILSDIRHGSTNIAKT